MSSKCCSTCARHLPLVSFLKDSLASPDSRVFATCISCRAARKKSADKKRTALQSLDPNIQPTGIATYTRSQKRARHSNTGPQPIVLAPLPLNLPVELPLLNPLTEPQPPQAPVTDRPYPPPEPLRLQAPVTD
jgi:hypothetical protein